MAKSKVKELITTTYKTVAEGTLDLEIEGFQIQPEDEDAVTLAKLFHRFDGEYVKITIEKKVEKEAEKVKEDTENEE